MLSHKETVSGFQPLASLGNILLYTSECLVAERQEVKPLEL